MGTSPIYYRIITIGSEEHYGELQEYGTIIGLGHIKAHGVNGASELPKALIDISKGTIVSGTRVGNTRHHFYVWMKPCTAYKITLVR